MAVGQGRFMKKGKDEMERKEWGAREADWREL